MKGLNVNGFVIVETLGSGRSGLLYLARHPTTGQEAIIRLAGNAEDGMTAKVFLEEAASLLPSLRGVEPSITSDGRSVLIARADAPTEPLPSVQPRSEARTEPLPQPRPGEGRTMHPNTAQLPVAVPGQPRRALPLAMMFIGLAALGAGITIAMLALRAPAPTALVAQPSAPKVALTPPPQPTTDAATGAAQPTPVAEGQPPVPAPEPLPVVPVRPTSVLLSVKPTAAPKVVCEPHVLWKRTMQNNLAEVEARANAMELVDVEAEVRVIGAAVERAVNQAQCEQAMRRFDALLKRAIK